MTRRGCDCCNLACFCSRDLAGTVYARFTISGLLASYSLPGPVTVTGMDVFNGVYLMPLDTEPGRCDLIRSITLDPLFQTINNSHYGDTSDTRDKSRLILADGNFDFESMMRCDRFESSSVAK